MMKSRMFRVLALVVVAAGVGVAMLMRTTNPEDAGLERTTQEFRYVGGILKERREVVQTDRGPLIDGIRTQYYPDGTKKIEMTYRLGRQIGKGTFWHAGGKRSAQGEFRDGKRHGEVTSWHPNGVVASKGSYAAGVRHGTFALFLEDGTKLEEGEYAHGLRTGTWRVYDENGRATEIEYAEDGKPKRS